MFDDFINYNILTDCIRTMKVSPDVVREFGMSLNDFEYVFNHYYDLKEQFKQLYLLSTSCSELLGKEKEHKKVMMSNGYFYVMQRIYGL